jgi:hypothetical protein
MHIDRRRFPVAFRPRELRAFMRRELLADGVRFCSLCIGFGAVFKAREECYSANRV